MEIQNKNSKLPLVISLCDYSGNWPYYYTLANYPVALFDLKHGDDIINKMAEVFIVAKTFNYNVLAVLAAPVCTDFSVSGAQYWKAKDKDGRTEQSLKLLDACIEIVNVLKPKYYAIENPVGRIPKLRPELGKPKFYFDPCDYAGYLDINKVGTVIELADEIRTKGENGEALTKEEIDFSLETNLYTKKTGIWGDFNIPDKQRIQPIKFKGKKFNA